MAKTSKPVAQRSYPSEFGSHSSMIDVEETAKLPKFIDRSEAMQVALATAQACNGQITLEDVVPFIDTTGYCVEKVVCKDQFGNYTTEKWRIDNGQADPNRWDGSRVKLG